MDLRTVAYEIAVQRVLRAIELRASEGGAEGRATRLVCAGSI